MRCVKNTEVDHFSFNIQKTHVAKEIDGLKTPLTITKGEVDVGLRKEREVQRSIKI